MPSFGVFDLVIGMVFIYLLLSFVCVAINEGIATVFNLRGKTLVTGVRALLHGPASAWTSTPLVDGVYGHPLISALHELRTLPIGKPKPPSYIPARTFTLALIDVMAGEGGAALRNVTSLRQTIEAAEIPKDTKRQLTLLIDEAEGDIEKAKKAIDRWFDDGMVRLSAVYKQRIQLIGLAVAVVVACSLDASTIRMARAMANDNALRSAIAEQAVAFYRNTPATLKAAGTPDVGSRVPGAKPAEDSSRAAAAQSDSILRQSRAILSSVTSSGLPLGMPDSVLASDHLTGAIAGQLWRDGLGLLITAFAISLGAPFWFDILNKVMNVRGAGRAPEEKPKSPEALPPARA